jgi:hypothetical protein
MGPLGIIPIGGGYIIGAPKINLVRDLIMFYSTSKLKIISPNITPK